MKHLKDILITPSTPTLKAIQIIDASQEKIALVVDKEGRLVGTVTDGDVRRGILRGLSVSQPVSRIMNDQPRSARMSDDKSEMLERMKKEQVLQMPILDAKGRVVTLEVMEELQRSTTRANWVVLMVGGLGTRLRPLTEHRPKPLLNVGKKPILETILENFIEHGFRKFYMSVLYKNEMVREHFKDGSRWQADIRYLHEEKKLGTAGALSLLPETPKEPLFVMNGDLLTKVNFTQLLDFHRENDSDATMCVREYDFQVPYGVVRLEKHHIRSIDEKPIHRFFINAGIYVLEPKLLKLIPKNKTFDMPDLFQKVIAKKGQTAAFPIREYWLDIGQIDDLERANGDFGKHFKK